MTKNEQQNAVLLYALFELNGSATRQEALQYIQDKAYWQKNDSNDEKGSKRPSENKWRNIISFARKHLVDSGYMVDGEKGIWAVSTEGYGYFETLVEKILKLPNENGCDFTDKFYDEIVGYHLSKECYEEEQLLIEIANSNISQTVKDRELSDQPIPKGEPSIIKNGKKVYKRDPEISQKALYIAKYECELDVTHKTFIRRNSVNQYMEPYHLIPISESEHFTYSLDREQNIFSLCCNCHKQIHYGAKDDVRRLVKKLFEMRKSEICKVIGKEISLEELYAIYKV